MPTESFLLSPGLGWHQYKHIFCTYKISHVEKMQQVNFQVAINKRGSDFDMQDKFISRCGISIIIHFQVLADISVCLYILCSTECKKESKYALFWEMRIWGKISCFTSTVFFFHTVCITIMASLPPPELQFWLAWDTVRPRSDSLQI